MKIYYSHYSILRRIRITAFLVLTSIFFLSGCIDDAQVLSPQPSSLELDDISPTCPGISSLTVTSGPSVTVIWSEGSDNYTSVSNLTYKIFMRKNAESFDLVSPAKIVQGATSTLISNGVSVGNTYTFFVTCTDERGNTFPTGPTNQQSVAVSDTQAPSAIVNLAVGTPTFTTLLLTWSPSDDGAGGTTAGNMTYKVYASGSASVSTAGAPLATVSAGGTSYLHSGLSPSATWYYRVVAVDSSGNLSADSNESTGTTTADVTVPAFAGNTANLVVTGTTTSSIGLSWTAASDNVTSAGSLIYRVYRCSGSTTCDPFGGTLVTTSAAGVTTFTDTGLSASTVYVYGVRAVDSSVNVSANTDVKITSTTYSSTGSTYAYPTIEEVNVRMGLSVAVANVVGAQSGVTAYPDLIVGAPNASEPGIAYRFTGCVFVFAGTGVGTFSSTATGLFCQPNASTSGTQNGLNFGSAIAVGDLDADGIDDIVVSNPLRFSVYIYRTQNSSGTLSIGTTGIQVTHPSSNTTFGTGLCIGNSDNVGADDLFIATTSENCSVACGGVTATGNLLVYNNTSTAGIFIAPSSVSYSISPTSSLQGAGYNISNSEVVVRSCTVGNFDPSNSTQTQLVIGSGTVSFTAAAATDGMIAFYRKTAANTFTFQNVIPTTTPSLTGNNWGQSLTRIELDGSGTHELVVGAPADSSVGTTSGAAYLYTVSTAVSVFSLTDTGDVFYGGTDFDNNAAGSAVASGNIWGHGDSKQDLVVGAYLDDNTMTIGASAINLGQVYTYRNTSGSISTASLQSSFVTTNYRVRHQQHFGTSLCRGDVNNDGREDLIVGAPLTDYDPTTLTNNNDVGAVYIYFGQVAGEIDFVNPSQIIHPPGSQSSSYFGNSCLVMDYDGDGLQDLLVGSPYRDVVQADRGAVYVYIGSSNSNLPSSNSSTINAPVAVASTLFGWSLAKGDFDADGYDDLAIGSIGRTGLAASSGVVYIYWADVTTHAITSASMTTLSPPSGALGAGGNLYLTNTQTVAANHNFGRSIESFRTVNSSTGVDLVVCSLGADVAIGAIYAGSPAGTDMGQCWIFEGKTNGSLVGNYQIMTLPKNEIRYPTGFSTPAANIYMGSAVTKGDWNTDGTQDLIVCASRQMNLTTTDQLAGGCFVYFGVSTGGFSQYNGYNGNVVTNRYVPQPDDFFYNPNAEPTTGSRFGESVLLMDLNNNGSLDLVIGEPLSDNPSGPTNLGADSGRVYILRGGY